MSEASIHGARNTSYEPPSDEQLERFIAVMVGAQARRLNITDINPAYAARVAMARPDLKADWLDRHRALQEALHDVPGARAALEGGPSGG